MSESEGEAAPRAQFELVTVKVEPCTFDDDDSTHGMDLRLRSSPKQILKLIEFMESNFDLARPEPGPQGKLRAERLWQDLTDILNSAGKAQKSTDKWKRVWADWKSKTKKKALTIKWDISLRGGSRQSLCVLEERVLRIMGLSKLIRPSGAAERGHQSNCHSSKNPPTATLPRPQSPPRLIELKFENHPLEEVVMKTPPATPPPPTPPPAPPLRRAGRSRRRVMTPLERAALRLVAVEERRLRMEERRDRRQHEREVEREQMHNEREMERLRVESQRLQVESRRNELLQCLADIPHILVELLAQPRPTIPNGPYSGPAEKRRGAAGARVKVEGVAGQQPCEMDEAGTLQYLSRPRCGVCQHSFGSAAALERHQRAHLPPPPGASAPCAVCGRRFLSAAAALRHARRAACDPAALTCEQCGKRCRSLPLLRSHARVHCAERPHACAQCGAAFKYRSTLARHAQLHAGRRPHACPHCGKTFTHPGLLRPHMRKHTGERPYECPVCLRRFSHKHNMLRHSLRHATAKRLECEVCHKAFPKESRLRYHMRVHSEDKRPFKCERCPKAFSHRQNVQRHYARKHPGARYERPDTDASVARRLWERLAPPKAPTHILPDLGAPDEGAPLVVEVDVERITLKREG